MTREERYPDTKVFHFYNANPKGRITGDCRIRGLTMATGIDYNTIIMGCAVIQVETGYDQCAHQGISIMLERLGWVKHRQPRKPNGKKYTGAEFCRVQQSGKSKDGIVISDRIFCNIGNHHEVAIIDGKVWDIWDSTGRYVGNYWTPGKDAVKKGALSKEETANMGRFKIWL